MTFVALAVAAQISVGAQLIPMLTRADPVPGGGDRTELKVVQSLVHAAAAPFGGRLMLHAMIDLEGLTMLHGQLAPGDFGEGFMDRRHAHTFAHELIASAVDVVRLPGARWSVTAGKGFAPFGSDDPMNRPPLVYPVNHHWSQILERAVVVGAARAGPLSVEGGLFNGDEPENPRQWPNRDRFGDSWSLRGTLMPAPGVEVQVSRARVASPEHRNGAGLDHAMWNASIRVERPAFSGRGYAMAEWARTDEEGAYLYHSVLVEAQYVVGPNRPYVRFESTDRPEEMRAFGDDFRSLRPHNENSNLGITHWSVLTAGYGRALAPRRWPFQIEGIIEAAFGRVTNVTGVIIDPVVFYGGNDLTIVSVALRIGAGGAAHRMGRYGIMAERHSSHLH